MLCQSTWSTYNGFFFSGYNDLDSYHRASCFSGLNFSTVGLQVKQTWKLMAMDKTEISYTRPAGIPQPVQRLTTDGQSGVWTPVWTGDLFSSTSVQTDPGAHPVSSTVGTGSLSLERKRRGVAVLIHPSKPSVPVMVCYGLNLALHSLYACTERSWRTNVKLLSIQYFSDIWKSMDLFQDSSDMLPSPSDRAVLI